jgi:hypothetical protein
MKSYVFEVRAREIMERMQGKSRRESWLKYVFEVQHDYGAYPGEVLPDANYNLGIPDLCFDLLIR